MFGWITVRTTDESPGSFKLVRRFRPLIACDKPSDPRVVWDTYAGAWALPSGHERGTALHYAKTGYAGPPEPTQQDADLATLARYFETHPWPAVAIIPFEDWTARVLAGASIAGIIDKARGTIEADILWDELRRLYDAQRAVADGGCTDAEWKRRMALPQTPARPKARCDHEWETIICGQHPSRICTLCGAQQPQDPYPRMMVLPRGITIQEADDIVPVEVVEPTADGYPGYV